MNFWKKPTPDALQEESASEATFYFWLLQISVGQDMK